jgi:hypothetical protein
MSSAWYTLLGGQETNFGGYEIDPAARISIGDDLKFAWFDYALKGAPRPALLADKVTYKVTGANRWGHAPTVPSATTLRGLGSSLSRPPVRGR